MWLEWNHTGVWWTPNPICPIRGHMKTEWCTRRMPWENEGRDWSYKTTSQIDGKSPEAKKRARKDSLTVFRWITALLMPWFWISNLYICKKINFCYSMLPGLRDLDIASLGNKYTLGTLKDSMNFKNYADFVAIAMRIRWMRTIYLKFDFKGRKVIWRKWVPKHNIAIPLLLTP